MIVNRRYNNMAKPDIWLCNIIIYILYTDHVYMYIIYIVGIY